MDPALEELIQKHEPQNPDFGVSTESCRDYARQDSLLPIWYFGYFRKLGVFRKAQVDKVRDIIQSEFPVDHPKYFSIKII